MALRSWLRRVEKRAGHSSFVLGDGTIHRYDFDQACGEMFTYCVQLWTAEEDTEPPEPQILTAIRRARDPVAVLSRFGADDPERGFVDPLVLLEDAPESQEDGS